MKLLLICGFALAAAFAVSLTRTHRPELGGLLASAAGAVIFASLVKSLSPFVSFVRESASELGVDDYFAVMLKALALSFICRISAETCRDCGESGLASKVETAGKIAIILTGLPVVTKIIDFAKDLMG